MSHRVILEKRAALSPRRIMLEGCAHIIGLRAAVLGAVCFAAIHLSAVIIFLAAMLMPDAALAYDSAEVLPVGINSPALRMGMITGIGQRYVSDGRLMSLGDTNSLEFDSATLIRVEPRVRELVNVLNQFGQYELGSALNLGVLEVSTSPEVRYVAPIHAFGLTKKWTVAVGLPVVTYSNQLSLSQTNSNLEAIRNQVGGLSSEIDSAFDQLGVSLVAVANQELAAKGYRALGDRRETFLGDIQLASLYQFYSSEDTKGLFKTIVSLPTGPSDDPDDLADLGIFGETSIEPTLIASSGFMNGRVQLSTLVSYRLSLPMTLIKRVPRTMDESGLLGPETKETVRRRSGDVATLGIGASLQMTQSLRGSLGCEVSRRGEEHYEGDRGSAYGLLSRDTAGEAQRVRVGLNYDTIKAYFSKEAPIPAIVSFEFSDTIRGLNVERRMVQELSLTLFF